MVRPGKGNQQVDRTTCATSATSLVTMHASAPRLRAGQRVLLVGAATPVAFLGTRRRTAPRRARAPTAGEPPVVDVVRAVVATSAMRRQLHPGRSVASSMATMADHAAPRRTFGATAPTIRRGPCHAVDDAGTPITSRRTARSPLDQQRRSTANVGTRTLHHARDAGSRATPSKGAMANRQDGG